ncbi:hypothetical protein AVEN_201447-1 [Araneus ventricosus]|uniref:Transmembrane protein n=1 Tax=Araneus ventricosus TaxID=182803 RepID=A0A4Y2K024_ARAVE|nr:hypothetical protein AVEN_201447-1 [Araneus ventricosus]
MWRVGLICLFVVVIVVLMSQGSFAEPEVNEAGFWGRVGLEVKMDSLQSGVRNSRKMTPKFGRSIVHKERNNSLRNPKPVSVEWVGLRRIRAQRVNIWFGLVVVLWVWVLLGFIVRN